MKKNIKDSTNVRREDNEIRGNEKFNSISYIKKKKQIKVNWSEKVTGCCRTGLNPHS